MEYFDIKKTANFKLYLIGQLFIMSTVIIISMLILFLPDVFKDDAFYLWCSVGILVLISLIDLIFNFIRFKDFFNTSGYLCTINVIKLNLNSSIDAEVIVGNKSFKVKAVFPGPYFSVKHLNRRFQFSCTAYIRKEDYRAMKDGANFNYVGVLYNN